MPPYDFTVGSSALYALKICEYDEWIRLHSAIEFLINNPRHPATFFGLDKSGRPIRWLEAGQFAIGYLTDHSQKMIHILDIRTIQSPPHFTA